MWRITTKRRVTISLTRARTVLRGPPWSADFTTENPHVTNRRSFFISTDVLRRAIDFVYAPIQRGKCGFYYYGTKVDVENTHNTNWLPLCHGSFATRISPPPDNTERLRRVLLQRADSIRSLRTISLVRRAPLRDARLHSDFVRRRRSVTHDASTIVGVSYRVVVVGVLFSFGFARFGTPAVCGRTVCLAHNRYL